MNPPTGTWTNMFVLSKLVLPSVMSISTIPPHELGAILYSVKDKTLYISTGSSWEPAIVKKEETQKHRAIQGQGNLVVHNGDGSSDGPIILSVKEQPIPKLVHVDPPKQKGIVAGSGINITDSGSNIIISSLSQPKVLIAGEGINIKEVGTNTIISVLKTEPVKPLQIIHGGIQMPTPAPVMNSLLWFDGTKFQASQSNTENVSVASRGMINQLVVGNIPESNDTNQYTLFVRKQNLNSSNEATVKFSFSGLASPNSKATFMAVENENPIPATSNFQLFTVRNKASNSPNLFSVNGDGTYLNFAPTITNTSTNLVIDTITGRIGMLPSDRKFKKNIKPAKISMSSIPQVFTYQYEGSSNDSHLKLGPMADDMDQDPNLRLLVARDGNGNVVGIDHHNLLSFCLGCLNEANQKIQTLEAKVDELENKFKGLLEATQTLHATVTTIAHKTTTS
jgi:hypothetical protein